MNIPRFMNQHSSKANIWILLCTFGSCVFRGILSSTTVRIAFASRSLPKQVVGLNQCRLPQEVQCISTLTAEGADLLRCIAGYSFSSAYQVLQSLRKSFSSQRSWTYKDTALLIREVRTLCSVNISRCAGIALLQRRPSLP